MVDISIYIVVGAAIILAIYGIYYFFKNYLEKQSVSVQQIKTTLESYGKLYEEGLFLSYEYQNEMYDVLIIRVPKSAKFQFNSPTIWEKRFGQKKFYTNQTVFSKMPHKKLVIIYPNEGPFTYHYDESEIRFTDAKKRFWNMHVIPMHALDTVLKEGFK